MGTLASELTPHAGRIAGAPRVYVDANVSASLVAYMRASLHWDALFIVEHDELRRASDAEHYRTARQLGRTLITLDRDYLDDRRFPPEQSGGVLVLAAPDERGFKQLLSRVDKAMLAAQPLPLVGRKLHLHVDWPGA
jgi:hypothetical protein